MCSLATNARRSRFCRCANRIADWHFSTCRDEKNVRTHDANCVLHASDRKGGDFPLTSKYATLYEMIELRRNLDCCIEVFAVDRFRDLLGQTAGHLRHIYRKFTTECDTTDP